MSKELANTEGANLLPILNPEQAALAYKAYNQLCQSILIPYDERIVDENGVVRQESDYVRIKQSKKDDSGKWITEWVDAPKKSAWRKLAKFYGVSTSIVEKNREDHENGSYTWHYTVLASTPNGISQDGEGSCTSSEKGGKSEHDTRSTAHTRAKSRAISDLIGFGQVSAEEMEQGPTEKPPRRVVESEVKTEDTTFDFSVDGIKAYFESLGYDPDQFTVRHDEPTRQFVLDKIPSIPKDKWQDYLNDVRELGGEYNKEYNKTVFRY